jgi:hypothetical protein
LKGSIILASAIILAFGITCFLIYDFSANVARAANPENKSISAMTINITGGNITAQNTSGTMVFHADNSSLTLMMHPCPTKKPGCPF